jgi:hypothetical protein
VLSTSGGAATAARRAAQLLRGHADHLTILVPHRARSAGTLLCLGADELVLGPMAELGPLDSLLGSAGQVPPDAPGMLSVEDVRAFREMAADWFGVDRAEDRLQVLALLAQRVFPASLGSLYRFDRMVRRIAEELLGHQLPNVDADDRRRIVDQLVSGYPAHDYILSRDDARELGLRVRFPSAREEDLLWGLSQALRGRLAEHPGQAEEETRGLIAASDFYAREVHRWLEAPPWRGGPPERVLDARWEILT